MAEGSGVSFYDENNNGDPNAVNADAPWLQNEKNLPGNTTAGGAPGDLSGDTQGTPVSSGPPAAPDSGQLTQQLQALAAQYPGAKFDPTDVQDVIRNTTYSGNSTTKASTLDQMLSQMAGKYQAEAAPTDYRTVDSQSAAGNALYGSGTGNGTNTPGGALFSKLTYNGGTGSGPGYPTAAQGAGTAAGVRPSLTLGNQFSSDPISAFLQQFASQRSGDLQNPPAGSGQSLLEQALTSIAQQFSQGGYTPAQQDTLNTQAIEPIEQLRQARKQQVVQQLSARGIDPQSGVAIQMLKDVDTQFDQLVGQQRRTLATQATTEQQQRMMQSVALLTQLAGTQDQRQNEAYQYATVPYNLAQTAFSNASGLYSQTGNPLSLIQPLLAASQQQTTQQGNQSQALGYLAYLIQSGALG